MLKNEGDNLSDDIIEIDDYEVKDKQIIETAEEDDYQGGYDNQREYDNQRGYDGQGGVSGFYKSVSLSNTALVIILMVVILLIVIFIMTFD